MIHDVPPSELKRVGYASVDVPAEAGSPSADVPALYVRIRPPGIDLPYSDDCMVKATAVLDTGASVSSIPMWPLWRLGIAADKGARQAAFGVQGDFQAYGVKIGVEIAHNNGWLDIAS